jgi:isoquinoline 1-oxidoreductase alpha subunit
MSIRINGRDVSTDGVDPQTPLLWFLRDHLGLTGTKFGCGRGLCGSCTVHLEGSAVRSCVLPIAGVEGASVTTIEGLAEDGDHPVQVAWRAHGVPQCGYCQSGQIMSAAALLARKKDPTDADIDSGMSGNICRCGTYPRIRAAIKTAASSGAGSKAGAGSTGGDER